MTTEIEAIPGAPAAPPVIEISPCKDVPGAMDIISTDGTHPIQIHFSAAGWAEFTGAVKRGDYDSAGKYDAAGT